jgi:hypothetical protein
MNLSEFMKTLLAALLPSLRSHHAKSHFLLRKWIKVCSRSLTGHSRWHNARTKRRGNLWE